MSGSQSASILLVEDDPIIRTIVAATLSEAGFVVRQADNGESAQASYSRSPADLVLMDIRLPDCSGHDVAQRLRDLGNPALIFLTGLADVEDRLRGLDLADDYLVKPVDLRELRARVRSVLRRWTRTRPAVPTHTLAGWTLDLVRRELLKPDGDALPLTRAEFDILAALVHADGVSLDRDYLLEIVGSNPGRSAQRSVDVLISRIRAKLTGSALSGCIVTVPNLGYRWLAPS